ncbi:hypothetical protein IMCC3317_13810 [Kordia antarctica]|uniref:Adhesin domain-containing protein n=1 Tax=Kordia antarctica TaxID=1218801 RepID=A0A7L4ZH12_9FLAO|nr:hypothetical protein [Kordia antarctica]QHI36028.1 hypothetical protein IMCC3317_13810 [Kordia antarctica]
MKTLLYKLIVFTFLLPVIAFANNGTGKHEGKYTKEKTITKEFSVNSDALLKVSNSYGTVHMTSWDKNIVAIEVTIKTNGDSEDKVTERLDQIGVDFSNSPAMVNAKTRFNKDNSKSWWKWNKRNKVNITVNYTIRFPKGNELNISNDYGAIFLNRAENKVSLNCDYGRMEIGELLGNDNSLNFDYSNNVTIAYMNNGRINADYSSFTINKAEDIILNADYTKSRFGTISNIEYNCEYNTLQIEQANDVKGTGDYLSLRLGIITGNIDVRADYGSIKIAEMTDDAGNIRIQSDYAGIKIGYQSQYYFNFELSLEYASIKGEDDFTMNKKRVESGERYYKGYYGNGTSGNNIYINSEYGSVRFEKL